MSETVRREMMTNKEKAQPDGTPKEGILWGSGIARKRPGPDRRAVIGSVSFHLALLMALVVSGFQSKRVPEFSTYRVKLYSPPPQVAAETQQEAKSASPIVVPRAEVKTTPQRTPPQPVVRRPTTTAAKPEDRKAASQPVAGPKPKADSPSGENIDVDIAGQEFPYPAYLENIILQLSRFFKWDGNPRLQANVMFYINRDGTVGGIEILDKSGELRFDLRALDAVSQAGRKGVFGELPTGWVQDKLYIKYRFLPPR